MEDSDDDIGFGGIDADSRVSKESDSEYSEYSEDSDSDDDFEINNGIYGRTQWVNDGSSHRWGKVDDEDDEEEEEDDKYDEELDDSDNESVSGDRLNRVLGTTF